MGTPTDVKITTLLRWLRVRIAAREQLRAGITAEALRQLAERRAA